MTAPEATVQAAMLEIHLPVTFDADNNPHIRQPHTSEQAAHEHARQLGQADKSIWRYEVHTFDLIDDAAAAPATEMRSLLEEALLLRQNGEHAPGGRENWHDWDEKAERLLRGES